MSVDDSPIITVCSSVNFYRHAVDLEGQLEAQGFRVILPKTAYVMKRTGDFERSHYQSWHTNPDDYHIKADYMRSHFDEVDKGDAVLVINDEKHGVANYIGGNVLMEMALAFYQRKPIFVLNGEPKGSALEEEVLGMQPVFLHGKVGGLRRAYDELSRASRTAK